MSDSRNASKQQTIIIVRLLNVGELVKKVFTHQHMPAAIKTHTNTHFKHTQTRIVVSLPNDWDNELNPGQNWEAGVCVYVCVSLPSVLLNALQFSSN